MEKQYLELANGLRAVARYDEYREDWTQVANERGIQVFTLNAPRGYLTAKTNDKHQEVLQMIATDYAYDRNKTEASNLIGTHFEAFKDISWLMVSFTGYSQGDWLEAVIYSDEGYGVADLKDVAEDLENIWRGECYVVSIEKPKVYTATDGSTLTEWLADEDYEDTYVVEEFFKLTEKFISEHYNLGEGA